jgi:hypothetical protein
MLEGLGLWFSSFFLSFLVKNFGWAEQGKAFMFIYMGVNVLIIALFIIICIIDPSMEEKIILLVYDGALIAIILFATWAATKLYNVDYYVVFQIMTFGKCLCSVKNEEDY